ncbi:hypothetical protein HZA43_02125 [Candidatus Peregrinibacteria bacterium]|nr:hypothetical protein [Candidatus Peregrinibacteria bacterium]
MGKTGEWGRFFPVSLSPFAYNETPAIEYYPLNKEEVLGACLRASRQGWKWHDRKDETTKNDKAIPANRLPEEIGKMPDDILNWIIKCEATGRSFRIIPQELKFYRQHQLPITHFHPDERHRRRMALRPVRKLWNRQCAKCAAPIQTTYSLDRSEIVYCEHCYLKTVY